MLRIEWSPENKKLTFDESWRPEYKLPNQSPGSAPCILGDWVIVNSNAIPAPNSASIIAIHQGDPTKIQRIEAIPLGEAPISTWPAKVACDTDNNMIYQYDFGPGKLVALNLNPETGELSVAWGPVDQRSFSFATLLGPAEERVLLGTNIKIASIQELKEATYTEQFVWRNARTGKVLARSPIFRCHGRRVICPLPGYGGVVYMLQSYGDITAMQVYAGSCLSVSA